METLGCATRGRGRASVRAPGPSRAGSTEAVGGKGPERSGEEVKWISRLRSGQLARWVWDQDGTAEPHRSPPQCQGPTEAADHTAPFLSRPLSPWGSGRLGPDHSLWMCVFGGDRLCIEGHGAASLAWTHLRPMVPPSPSCTQSRPTGHPCLRTKATCLSGPQPTGVGLGEPLCPPALSVLVRESSL